VFFQRIETKRASPNKEQELLMTYKPTGRPRGAPLNNINHLKHGLYSNHISVKDDEQACPMSEDKTSDELALARSRIKKILDKQGSVSSQEWLSYEKAVSHYIGQVITMLHMNAVFGRDKKAPLLTVMDFIRQANEDQNVK
jgi:hypothetical protein